MILCLHCKIRLLVLLLFLDLRGFLKMSFVCPGTFSSSTGLLSKDVLMIVYKSQLKTLHEWRQRAFGHQASGFLSACDLILVFIPVLK